jgi:hypothetical protein
MAAAQKTTEMQKEASSESVFVCYIPSCNKELDFLTILHDCSDFKTAAGWLHKFVGGEIPDDMEDTVETKDAVLQLRTYLQPRSWLNERGLGAYEDHWKKHEKDCRLGQTFGILTFKSVATRGKARNFLGEMLVYRKFGIPPLLVMNDKLMVEWLTSKNANLEKDKIAPWFVNNLESITPSKDPKIQQMG